MDVQEWDIDLADKVTLVFYDLITVQIADGREIPIWAKDSDTHLGNMDADLPKLVFTSKQPISIQQARSLQGALRARKEKGWYHEIY